MNLDELKLEVYNDLKVNNEHLDTESLKNQEIKAKYLDIKSKYELLLFKAKGDYKRIYRDKWEYYGGKSDAKVYVSKPFDIKVLKTDLSVYITSDEEIIDAENNVIKATHEHPLLIQRYHDEVDVDGTSRMIYRWVRVRELLASDRLITIDGTPIDIHSIRKVVGEDIFYSLNVEVTDSYIVRWGDKMVIAHNEVGK